MDGGITVVGGERDIKRRNDSFDAVIRQAGKSSSGSS
jgi:hypothetical protein